MRIFYYDTEKKKKKKLAGGGSKQNRVGSLVSEPGQKPSQIRKKAPIRQTTAFPRRAARSAVVSDLQPAPDRWRPSESQDRTISGVRSRF